MTDTLRRASRWPGAAADGPPRDSRRGRHRLPARDQWRITLAEVAAVLRPATLAGLVRRIRWTRLADLSWRVALGLAVVIFLACGLAQALGYVQVVYYLSLIAVVLSAAAVPVGMWGLRHDRRGAPSARPHSEPGPTTVTVVAAAHRREPDRRGAGGPVRRAGQR